MYINENLQNCLDGKMFHLEDIPYDLVNFYERVSYLDVEAPLYEANRLIDLVESVGFELDADLKNRIKDKIKELKSFISANEKELS